jgi:hypothetical protein
LTEAQLQAITAAIAAGVQTGVSQAMSQASQEIAKQVAESISGATDSDSGYLVRTSIDPGDSQRRAENHRNRVEAYCEQALADCIEFRKACDSLILRKISQDSDHHAGLPPMAPRAASGPGVTAS